MKTYWRSIEELANPKDLRRSEVREDARQNSLLMKGDKEMTASSRRDFLKTFGFSVAAASIIASCKRPVHKAIPYLVKPDEITPGEANYYASSYFEGNEYASIIVKVRDGRPIKIEGNELSSISQGGTSARVQASVLNLYDDARFKEPLFNGKPISWEEADKDIIQKLSELNSGNGKIVLLSSTIISPSTREIINEFISKNKNAEWIQYDAVSASAILQANSLSFGSSFLPDYKFGKAKIAVSFNADFLGSWLSPVEYTKAYSSARQLQDGEKSMLRHYQFESGMTLTGSNADVRFPIKPSEEGAIILALYNAIAVKKGLSVISGAQSTVDITDLADDLLSNEKESIVISGSNDVNIQILVNEINYILGNYGNTIGLENTLMIKQGLDSAFNNFVKNINSGIVDGVVFWNVNPVYDHPQGIEISKAISKLKLSISLSERPDETTALCNYVLPESNYLESWNDFEPKSGIFSLCQPTIAPIFNSRQGQETLLRWIGNNVSYHEYLKEFWSKNIFPVQNEISDAKQFWTKSLQNGVFEIDKESKFTYAGSEIYEAATKIKNAVQGVELSLYESVALGNGRYANNPWLQELPDPVAKISWDNFASVPVQFAEENNLKNEDVIKINGIDFPVFIQPGQAENTISVAIGYGRTIAGKVGENVGINTYSFVSSENGNRKYYSSAVNIEKVSGKTYELAISQTHHSMEGRPIVRETTLADYINNPSAGNELKAKHEAGAVSLYDKPVFNGHHWGMAVDLSSCTGCGNCAIACQAENNVQVIGKEQVRNRRIMHWIRIDRYYSENPNNPKVSFQPVMCQHCDNAPCENVCPVAATPHSEEGLNQMAYNRCVGTKYCMNNCPYRVRRFNWFEYIKNDKFDYASNSDLGRMVLNPDVTVRSRGVVEKCSMCVQRIQEKKQTAKLEGRQLVDGEIKTACSQSCPANAIVFGDLSDPESRISKLFKDKRNYHLLEELHTLPSVGYLTKVRNTNS